MTSRLRLLTGVLVGPVLLALFFVATSPTQPWFYSLYSYVLAQALFWPAALATKVGAPASSSPCLFADCLVNGRLLAGADVLIRGTFRHCRNELCVALCC